MRYMPGFLKRKKNLLGLSRTVSILNGVRTFLHSRHICVHGPSVGRGAQGARAVGSNWGRCTPWLPSVGYGDCLRCYGCADLRPPLCVSRSLMTWTLFSTSQIWTLPTHFFQLIWVCPESLKICLDIPNPDVAQTLYWTLGAEPFLEGRATLRLNSWRETEL